METVARYIADFLALDLVYGYLAIGIVIGIVIGRVSRAGRNALELSGGARKSGSAITKVTTRTTLPGSVEMELNGEKLDIDQETIAEVRRLAAQGDKIGAIKHLRAGTSLGLADAKQLVEVLERMRH